MAAEDGAGDTANKKFANLPLSEKVSNFYQVFIHSTALVYILVMITFFFVYKIYVFLIEEISFLLYLFTIGICISV